MPKAWRPAAATASALLAGTDVLLDATCGRLNDVLDLDRGQFRRRWRWLIVPFLRRYGMAADLLPPRSGTDLAARSVPGSAAGDETAAHVLEVIQRFVRAHTYADLPWQEAQAYGLLWAPLRRPHENAVDERCLGRRTFADIDHPEFGRRLRNPTSKWLSSATSWQPGRRAPRCGEHTAEAMREAWHPPPAGANAAARRAPRRSARGKPFAQQDIRILDFSWFLASAGGTRFAAAFGADCIKVEWN